MERKVFRLRLPLRNPFRIAHGSSSFRESVFLWLRAGDAVGMGEAPVVPYYGDTADSVEADLVCGAAARAVEDAVGGAGAPRGEFARAVSRSAFQSAVLSLRARLSGVSSSPAIGPPTSYTIAFNDDPEAMARIASSCGFRRLKVKAGIPGDIERIRLLRERLPQAIIRVDANQGWSLEEAPVKLAELERLGVELVEEPVAGSPAELGRLAAATSVPVLLDESVRDLAHFRRCAREAPSVAGIVVKTAKNGGPAASLELARAARDRGMRVMVSSMVETSLGVSSALTVAPFCDWCDLDAPLLLSEDPFTGLFLPRRGPPGGGRGRRAGKEPGCLDRGARAASRGGIGWRPSFGRW